MLAMTESRNIPNIQHPLSVASIGATTKALYHNLIISSSVINPSALTKFKSVPNRYHNSINENAISLSDWRTAQIWADIAKGITRGVTAEFTLYKNGLMWYIRPEININFVSKLLGLKMGWLTVRRYRDW